MEKTWKCPECDEPEMSTKRKGMHIMRHRRAANKIRRDQEKRYTVPEKEVVSLVYEDDNFRRPTKKEEAEISKLTAPKETKQALRESAELDKTLKKIVEFDLWNVITINGVDYINTLILEEGREIRVGKPHRIGQVMHGEKGSFKIDKSLMNELLNRDSIANEAERRVFDQKKIKLHYETDGVKKMSMKV